MNVLSCVGQRVRFSGWLLAGALGLGILLSGCPGGGGGGGGGGGNGGPDDGSGSPPPPALPNPPHWRLKLTNNTQAPATLMATHIDYVSPPPAVTAGTGGSDDTIRVPAKGEEDAGEVTLQIPCTVDAFTITDGVEGAPPAATPRPVPLADCMAAGTTTAAPAPVEVMPEYWQLTLVNPLGSTYTVEISAAPPALRDFVTSPYANIPRISAAGVLARATAQNGYVFDTGLITLEPGQRFVAQLLCGEVFVTTAVGENISAPAATVVEDSGCGDVVLGAHWTLKLTNSTQAPARVKATHIDYVDYVDDSPAITAGQGGADDTLTVPAGRGGTPGALTLRIPCGTDTFTIMGGVEEPIPPDTSRPDATPGDAEPAKVAACIAASPTLEALTATVLAAADVAVTPQYWELALTHNGATGTAAITAVVDAADRNFTGGNYVFQPRISGIGTGETESAYALALDATERNTAFEAATLLATDSEGNLEATADTIRTIALGETFVARILCGQTITFASGIRDGGDNNVQIAYDGDGNNCTDNLNNNITPARWQLTLTNSGEAGTPAVAATINSGNSDSTSRTVYYTTPSSALSGSTLTLAHDATFSAELLCGQSFTIDSGIEELEESTVDDALVTQKVFSSSDCSDSSQMISLPRWTVVLTNSNGEDSVVLTLADAVNTFTDRTVYFAAPTQGASVSYTNPPALTILHTGTDTQRTFTAELLCDVDEFTITSGTGTGVPAAPSISRPGSDAAACEDEGDDTANDLVATVYVPPDVWLLTLQNATPVPVVLHATHIASLSAIPSTAITAAGNSSTPAELAVAANSTATLFISCAAASFTPVTGGDTEELPAAVARPDTETACDAADPALAVADAVVLEPRHWQLTLTNSTGVSYTVGISESRQDFSATPYVRQPTIGGNPVVASGNGANYSGGIITLADGQSFVAQLRCSASFAITAGGDAEAQTIVQNDTPTTCGDAATVTYETPPNWQLTLSNPTQVPVEIRATSIAYVEPTTTGPNSVAAGSPNDTLTVAAGGSLTLNVPCGTDFRVVAGGDALEAGNTDANRDSPDDCRGATNSGGTVDLKRAYWQLTLHNDSGGSYTVEISAAPATLRILSTTPYVELPQIGAPGAPLPDVTPSNYDAGIITLADRESFVAKLLCGENFVITADGLGTTRTTRTNTVSQRGTACADADTVVYRVPLPSYWTVLLTNATQAPATLTATSIAYVRPQPGVVAGTPDTLTVPAATGNTPGQLTLRIPCDVATFTITGGAESTLAPTARPAADSPSPDPVADCDAASNASPSAPLAADAVPVMPQYWELTLTNSTGGDYTVEISAAADPALRALTASPYVEFPKIGALGAPLPDVTPSNYDAGIITLADGESFVAKLLCGVDFVTTADGSTTRTTRTTTTPSGSNCGNNAVTYSPPIPVWQLTLTNSTQLPVEILATSIAYVTPTTTGPSRVVAGSPNDTLTVAAGGSLTLNVPCGTDFRVVAGGNPLEAGNAAANRDSPSTCTGQTNAPADNAGNVVLARAYWQLTLENSTGVPYTVEISAAPPALRTLSTSPYVELPQIGDSDVVSSGNGANYSSGIITLADEQSFVAKLLCGESFAITAGGDAAALAISQKDTPPCGDADTVTYNTPPNWQLTLTNPTQLPVEIQATHIDYVEPTTSGASMVALETPDSAKDTITVAAGGSLTLNVPCGTDFVVVDGGNALEAGNTEANRDSPGDCRGETNAPTGGNVVLARAYWELALTHGGAAGTAAITAVVDAADRTFSGGNYVYQPRISSDYATAADDTERNTAFNAATLLAVSSSGNLEETTDTTRTIARGETFLARILCDDGAPAPEDLTFSSGIEAATEAVTYAESGTCDDLTANITPARWTLTLGNSGGPGTPAVAAVINAASRDFSSREVYYTTPQHDPDGAGDTAAGDAALESDGSTFTLAHDATFTAELLCGQRFIIDSGIEELVESTGTTDSNTGRDLTQRVFSSGDCSDVTDAMVSLPRWTLALTNNNGTDSVVLTLAENPAGQTSLLLRTFAAGTVYFAVPDTSSNSISYTSPALTILHTGTNTQRTFTAELLCDVNEFAISSGTGEGVPTGASNISRPGADADACKDQGDGTAHDQVVETYAPSNVWELTLHNPTQQQVVLHSTSISQLSVTSANLDTSGTPDVITVAAGQMAILFIPCTTENFTPIEGGNTETLPSAVARPGEAGTPGTTACNAPDSALAVTEAVMLEPRHWVLTLTHDGSAASGGDPADASVTVSIDSAHQAINGGTYLYRPSIAGSRETRNTLTEFTLAPEQVFSAQILCDADGATSAAFDLSISGIEEGNAATAETYTQGTTNTTCDDVAENITPPRWMLTLANSGVENTPDVAAAINSGNSDFASRTVYYTTPSSALSGSTLTLAHDATFTAQLLCGQTFTIDSGIEELVGTGTTQKVISSGSNCADNSATISLPRWTLTLTNNNGVDNVVLTLAAAVNTFAAGNVYFTPPTVTAPITYVSSVLTIPHVTSGDARTFTAELLCDVAVFAISSGTGMGVPSGASSIDRPAVSADACKDEAEGAATDQVAVAYERPEVWQLTLTNPSQLPVQILATHIDYVGSSSGVTEGTPDTIDVAAAGSLTLNVPCGTDFVVAAGGDVLEGGNAAANRDSPVGCSDFANTPAGGIVVLARAYWELALTHDGAAGTAAITAVVAAADRTFTGGNYVYQPRISAAYNPSANLADRNTAFTNATQLTADGNGNLQASGSDRSIARGETFLARILCGQTITFASGIRTADGSVNNAQIAYNQGGSCADSLSNNITPARWTLTLTNSGVENTPDVAAIINGNSDSTSRTVYYTTPSSALSGSTLTLAHNATFTAQLLCGQTFTIDSGIEELVGTSPTQKVISSGSNCADNSDTISLPRWTLTLTNSNNENSVELTLDASVNTFAAGDVYFAIPDTSSGSISYASSVLTILHTGTDTERTFTAELLCDVGEFTISSGAGTGVPDPASIDRPADDADDCKDEAEDAANDQVAVIYAQPDVWMLTLHNPTQQQVILHSTSIPDLRVTSATLAAGTPDMITVAAGQMAILQIPCATDNFDPIAGGNTETLPADVPRPDGQTACNNASPALEVADAVMLEPRHWVLTLTHDGSATSPADADVTVTIADAEGYRDIDGGTYLYKPSRQDIRYTEDTLASFTLAPTEVFRAQILCEVGGDSDAAFDLSISGIEEGGANSAVTYTQGTSCADVARTITPARWTLTLTNSGVENTPAIAALIHAASRDFTSRTVYYNAPTLALESDGSTLTLAHDATFTAELLCGQSFQISGGIYENQGSNTYSSSSSTCGDNAGDSSGLSISPPRWTLVLDNTASFSVDVGIHDDDDDFTDRALYYATPQIDGANVGSQLSGTVLTLAGGDTFTAILLCDQTFVITGGVADAQQISYTKTGDACTDGHADNTETVTLTLPPKSWTVTLRNDTQAEARVKATLFDNQDTLDTADDTTTESEEHSVSAGGGMLAVTVSCEFSAFQITVGAESNSRIVERSDASGNPATEAACRSSEPAVEAAVAIEPAYWEVRLQNNTRDQITVVLSSNLRSLVASPYVEAPTIGGNAPSGTNYNSTSGTITLEEDEIFVAKVICGVDFAITSGTPAEVVRRLTISQGSSCGDRTVAYSPPAVAEPVWWVYVQNESQLQPARFEAWERMNNGQEVTGTRRTYSLGPYGNTLIKVPCSRPELAIGDVLNGNLAPPIDGLFPLKQQRPGNPGESGRRVETECNANFTTTPGSPERVANWRRAREENRTLLRLESWFLILRHISNSSNRGDITLKFSDTSANFGGGIFVDPPGVGPSDNIADVLPDGNGEVRLPAGSNFYARILCGEPVEVSGFSIGGAAQTEVRSADCSGKEITASPLTWTIALKNESGEAGYRFRVYPQGNRQSAFDPTKYNVVELPGSFDWVAESNEVIRFVAGRGTASPAFFEAVLLCSVPEFMIEKVSDIPTGVPKYRIFRRPANCGDELPSVVYQNNNIGNDRWRVELKNDTQLRLSFQPVLTPGGANFVDRFFNGFGSSYASGTIVLAPRIQDRDGNALTDGEGGFIAELPCTVASVAVSGAPGVDDFTLTRPGPAGAENGNESQCNALNNTAHQTRVHTVVAHYRQITLTAPAAGVTVRIGSDTSNRFAAPYLEEPVITDSDSNTTMDGSLVQAATGEGILTLAANATFTAQLHCAQTTFTILDGDNAGTHDLSGNACDSTEGTDLALTLSESTWQVVLLNGASTEMLEGPPAKPEDANPSVPQSLVTPLVVGYSIGSTPQTVSIAAEAASNPISLSCSQSLEITSGAEGLPTIAPPEDCATGPAKRVNKILLAPHWVARVVNPSAAAQSFTLGQTYNDAAVFAATPHATPNIVNRQHEDFGDLGHFVRLSNQSVTLPPGGVFTARVLCSVSPITLTNPSVALSGTLTLSASQTNCGNSTDGDTSIALGTPAAPSGGVWENVRLGPDAEAEFTYTVAAGDVGDRIYVSTAGWDNHDDGARSISSLQVTDTGSLDLTDDARQGRGGHFALAFTAGAVGTDYTITLRGSAQGGRPVSLQVDTAAATMTNVLDVAIGENHACFAQGAGTGTRPLCVGKDTHRQVGPLGDTSLLFHKHETRTSIVDGEEVSDSIPDLETAGETRRSLAITAGGRHSCALTDASNNQGAICWGDNTYGQLGAADYSQHSTPVTVRRVVSSGGFFDLVGAIFEISAGAFHTCVRMSTPNLGDDRAGVYCWGANFAGVLGLGRPGGVGGAALTTPIPAENPFGTAPPTVSDPLRSTSHSTINIFSGGYGGSVTYGLSSGAYHVCIVYDYVGDEDGSNDLVLCWGQGDRGQLGLDQLGSDSQIVQRNSAGSNNPDGAVQWLNSANQETVTGASRPLLGTLRVSSGAAHTCAVVRSGSSTDTPGIFCWGANDKGQVGDGTTTDQGSAKRALTITDADAARISAGSAHTCAIADGEVKCWGDNTYGQLGTNTTTDQPTAASAPAIDFSGYAAFGTPTKLSQGYGALATCAIAGSRVACWGKGTSGLLGNGLPGTPADDEPELDATRELVPGPGDISANQLLPGPAYDSSGF